MANPTVDPGAQVVTIAVSASLSESTEVKGKNVEGLHMPDAWTAADVTFEASFDDTVFGSLTDDTGAEVKVVSPAVGEYISLDREHFRGVRFLKVRSGTAAAPVNQLTTAKPMTLVVPLSG